MNAWRLYDDLIGGIPEDITVAGCIAGYNWTCVTSSEGGAGLAKAMPAFNLPYSSRRQITGGSLKQLAELSRSWNFAEASLGVAAINAYYNHPGRAHGAGIPHPGGERNVFKLYSDEVRGLKVTVIGHFPNLERNLGSVCEMTILERDPQTGELPDSACEYILCEQDYVFITGCTLVNKTLPRLLELSKNARTVIVGPSTVLSKIMFDHGAYGLSGMIVSDPQRCGRVMGEGNPPLLFDVGEMVDFINPSR